MKRLFAVLLVVLSSSLVIAGDNVLQQDELAKHLQDISVTVLSGASSGSGVIITKDVKPHKDSTDTVKVNFVLTAGHVVDNLRTIRSTVDPKTGTEKKVIEFNTVSVVKDLVEEGRKVGETRMTGRVMKYSDAETGEDLALCMLDKRNFISSTVKFHVNNDKVIPIGTPLLHVGSLLGQGGSNSMTTGIMSQVGRVLPLGNGTGVVFDQTTVTAFPGSSGGGVFLANGADAGEQIGVLVRGAGETFNLIVPVRRIHKWTMDTGLEWILDESKPVPSLDELNKMPVE